MRINAALLAAGLALVASHALAEGGPRPAEIDALVAAIVAAGCVVNDANQAAVLRASGLSTDVAAGVLQRLSGKGLVETVAGSHALRLKTGGCK
ncbi:hypothetical protein [Solirhodobacter olei]|uniref:hypothetical protein n=1 Tax=Solirhodobacter olei TaxID=2493082 RepID=UPI000FD72308|nr:hypothetical protein [Solirhodobacter olei]